MVSYMTSSLSNIANVDNVGFVNPNACYYEGFHVFFGCVSLGNLRLSPSFLAALLIRQHLRRNQLLFDRLISSVCQFPGIQTDFSYARSI